MLVFYKQLKSNLVQVWMPWGAHLDLQPDTFIELRSMLVAFGCEFREFSGRDPWAADSSLHRERMQKRLDTVIPVTPEILMLSESEWKKINKLLRSGELKPRWFFFAWDFWRQDWIPYNHSMWAYDGDKWYECARTPWVPGQVLFQYDPYIGAAHFLSPFVVDHADLRGHPAVLSFRYVSETYPYNPEKDKNLWLVETRGLIPLTQFPIDTIRKSFFIGLETVRGWSKQVREETRPHRIQPILSLKKQKPMAYTTGLERAEIVEWFESRKKKPIARKK